MSSWTIVALPSEQDYVNQISSEKVAHMTLLFLGEQDDDEMAARIAGFVEHATETYDRFGLSVDHRGTLGPQDADVLFFSDPGMGMKNVKEFRANLLTNLDIFKAWRSAEQYPEWTPHLTLGYPTSPAKKYTRDYPGISWVNFDRIAFWTDDFSGYEFLLPDHMMSEVGWSGISKGSNVSDELEHHGVKGMHWGVRGKGDTKSILGNAASIALKGRSVSLQKRYDRVKAAHAEHPEVKKLNRKQLNPKNPVHAFEIQRRNKRNREIAAVGILAVKAIPLATAAAGSAYLVYNGQRNKKVFGAATSTIKDSKAIQDGSVYALRLLSNGAFG